MPPPPARERNGSAENGVSECPWEKVSEEGFDGIIGAR
jgi:hypothetical protein